MRERGRRLATELPRQPDLARRRVEQVPAADDEVRRPARASSTTTQNAYVQLPCRSRIGRSPDGATSSRHGPTSTSIHDSPRRRAPTRTTGPSGRDRDSRPGSRHPTTADRCAAAHAENVEREQSQPYDQSVRLQAARARPRYAALGASGSVWRTGPRSARKPSQSRSSSSASSYSGRQRWRSWSSIRSRTRAPGRRGQPPRPDGVRDVPEMEVAGRRRREPGQGRRRRRADVRSRSGRPLPSRSRPVARAIARLQRPRRREQAAVQREEVGLRHRSLVGHRHAQQDLALPLGIADRRVGRPRPWPGPASRATPRALVEQGHDPPVEHVDPTAQPPQLRRSPGRRAVRSAIGATEPPGDRLEREVIAAGALPDDRLERDVVQEVDLAERLAGRRVGQVDLDERPLDREQRIAQRDARVGEPAGVDDRDVEVARVQTVDQGALVVRLEEVDVEAELARARRSIPAWISSSVS